ncbi:MAG: IS5 family transposase [bacterium]
MRGYSDPQQPLFITRSMDERIPLDHPIRPLRDLVDRALAELGPQFDALYAPVGRPSIPPEQLLRALLVQILYSIRSERQLIEQLNYNLLYRWFVGLGADDPVWDHSTFSKNRERLEAADVATAFFRAVVGVANQHRLLSHEHFSVDGTLLEAAASLKTLRRKDGRGEPPQGGGKNPDVNFHGERRSNATHESVADPDARLARKGKGKETKLCHLASTLMENRHGLIVATDVRPADGSAEVEAAIDLLATVATPRQAAKTVGGDRGFNQLPFVERSRALGFTPHVAMKTKGNAVDGRTTHSPGYEVSQRKRKLIEQGFGWGKTIGLLRKLRHRGQRRVAAVFAFTCAAFNLVRMRTLLVGVPA